MAINVKGLDSVRRNISKQIGDIRGKKVVRAVQSALLIGGAQSALYTPIDTSMLINSQFRDVTINGMRITGRVGYSANYALSVHDPKIKQKFRRSTARKEFLSLGFDEARDDIDRAVAEEMKL